MRSGLTAACEVRFMIYSLLLIEIARRLTSVVLLIGDEGPRDDAAGKTAFVSCDAQTEMSMGGRMDFLPKSNQLYAVQV